MAGTPLTGVSSYLRVNTLGSVVSEPYRLYAVIQPSASATAESEPNDMITQADAAANNYFSGSLAGPAPSTDEDLYSFTAEAGELIFLVSKRPTAQRHTHQRKVGLARRDWGYASSSQ